MDSHKNVSQFLCDHQTQTKLPNGMPSSMNGMTIGTTDVEVHDRENKEAYVAQLYLHLETLQIQEDHFQGHANKVTNQPSEKEEVCNGHNDQICGVKSFNNPIAVSLHRDNFDSQYKSLHHTRQNTETMPTNSVLAQSTQMGKLHCQSEESKVCDKLPVSRKSGRASDLNQDCTCQNCMPAYSEVQGYLSGLLPNIIYMNYDNEKQMSDIMNLIQKDLSEPYSIYTYRYFIHNWPKLCFLAVREGVVVGAIVCKLDVHKKVFVRGYIAMLAVDQRYRKNRIGSTLVQQAVQAMLLDNADEIVLETEITNKPALKLYENLGFVRDKRLFSIIIVRDFCGYVTMLPNKSFIIHAFWWKSVLRRYAI